MTGAGWLVPVPCQRIPTHGDPIHRHSRESGNPIPRPGFRVFVSLHPECRGAGWFVPFLPLCRKYWHGWRPAGFGPLPWGRVPFCLQQQKGTKKCRPSHPAFSCASRPDRGSADAFLRAADVSHPWLTPLGLIRSDLRCSGGTKGKLARLAGIAQVGRSPMSREAITLHACRCKPIARSVSLDPAYDVYRRDTGAQPCTRSRRTTGRAVEVASKAQPTPPPSRRWAVIKSASHESTHSGNRQ